MRSAIVFVACGLGVIACKPRDRAADKTSGTRVLDAAVGGAEIDAAPVAVPGQRTIGSRAAAGDLRKVAFPEMYELVFVTAADAARGRAAAERALAKATSAEVAPAPLAETMFRPESLQYRGVELSDDDRARLASASTALRVTIEHAAGDHLADELHLASRAARAGAAAGHGWIVDPYSAQVFSVDGFDHRRPADFPISAGRTITIDLVRGDDGGIFLESIGMLRFGLPELYVRGVPASYGSQVATIVNAAAQTLIERGGLARDGVLDVDTATLTTDPWPATHRELVAAGGTGKATLAVTWSTGDDDHHDADPELELTLGDGTAAGVAAVRRAFHGLDEDTVHQAAAGDAELEAARARAKAELAKLAPHFAKGIPDLEQLLVKAPFETDDGGTEWMWVEVHAWRGKQLSGVLANQPYQVSGLKEGADVVVQQDDLFDYTHRRADGTEVGGETNAILERQ